MDRKPECELATQQALAIGAGWKAELEKQTLITNNELSMKLANLAQSQTHANEAMAALAETVKEDHGLVVSAQEQIKAMRDWQIEEGKRHEKEEAARKTAADKLEEERKERVKPLKDILWTLIKQAALVAFGVTMAALWEYFKLKTKGGF